MTTTIFKKRIRVSVAAMALSVGLVSIPTAAFAEGQFSSSIDQAQPGFSSRTWTDNNLDNASTTVTLSGCKVNRGGQPRGSARIQSIVIGLYNRTGYYSERSRGDCGTFSWGRLGKGEYYFRIQSINGVTATSGERFFLDASSVVVKY